MAIKDIVTIIIAMLVAYLMGSIPFAYIFTRLITGKDIRELGSGNGGAHNVFREIGMKVAVPVAIFDLGKGALAVIIACKLLNIPIKEINLFVLLAALAVICGHMWSIYLKFRGGNGLSATFGAFAVIMPWELLVAIGLLLILVMITRNLVLSTNLGLLSVPISAWFIDSSLLLVVFSILVGVLLVIHFIPTAKRAIIQAGSEQKLIARLIRKQ